VANARQTQVRLARPAVGHPHGRAAMRLAGLKAGRYPIEVDGVRRGALIIGAEPGP